MTLKLPECGRGPCAAHTDYWWDSTQPTGTTVYYRVTVHYADGTESGASQTVAVTD
ncbi:hypothetical protein [Streptomyces sp. NPDC005181]|uniref:hypothetical protein n=1 Tax=Streptomyces sp. NPDC005181 TaxID=3156869 RepID=UPI0033A0CC0F